MDYVAEICKAHQEYCKEREKSVRCGWCGGQTVENTPNKCKDCPYQSEWSCLVKFALEYNGKKED